MLEYWKYAVIALIIIAIVVITIIIIKRKKTYTDTVPDSISINTRTILMNSDDSSKQIVNTSGSTILGLFNFQFANRTQTLNNKYISILGINSSWNLEILRHPTKTDITTARLRVTTLSGNGVKDEVISLPDIPLQKWVMIGILRDGRRFDVMYDGVIVSSQRVQNYPHSTPSPLTVGNSNIVGNVVHVIVYPERLNSNNVNRVYTSLVDTNGAPKKSITELILPGKISMSFPSLSGVFSVDKTPSDNLKAWSTPYA